MVQTLPDGRTIQFPEGTDDSTVQAYIAQNFPAEPNIAERTIGHLSKGMAEVMKKVSNVGSYLSGEEPTPGPYQQYFESNPMAAAVTAHPETSFLGQAAGGLVEFLPQVPIYTVGGRAVLGAASKLPAVGKYAESLLTPAATTMGRYGKAIARGAAEGGIVGTAIGTSAQTPIVEKLTEGGKDALGFGAATAVLHPVFSVLGAVGKGVVRRLGKKATPDSVEAKLAEKAKTDPAAAADLEALKEARANQPTEAEELYVPKGEETIVPSRLRQGELALEPLPEETLAEFGKLGYTEADLVGKADKELIDILESKKENDKITTPTVEEPVKVDITPTISEPTIEGETSATRKTRVRLEKLGYTAEDISALKPGEQISIIKNKQVKGAEVTSEVPSVQNLNKATPEEVYTLQRLGFSGKDIKGMKAADRQVAIDRVKNIPDPAPEELAAAEEAAKKIQEAAILRQQAKAIEGKPPQALTPEYEASIEAEIEKDLETADSIPISKAAELIIKMQNHFDDATLDTLVENMPKSKEEIALDWKIALERRNMKIEAEKLAAGRGTTPVPVETTIVPEAAKVAAQESRADLDKRLKAIREKKKAADRRKKDTTDIQSEYDKLLEEEGLGEIKEEGEGELIFDMLGGQQIYNFAKKLLGEKKNIEGAASNDLISEVSGSKMTFREGSAHTDSVLSAIAKNIGRFGRTKLATPEFAYGGDPTRGAKNVKMESLIYDLHKSSFDGDYAASKSNEVARASRALLTPKQELMVKKHIEKTAISTDPAVIKAAGIIEKEQLATLEKIKEAKRRAFKENLNEDENAALSEIISGSPIDEVIAKYRTRIVPDKLGRRRVRTWLDEEAVRDMAKEYKGIDSWGEENYVTHYERGNIRIVSGGKLYAKAMSVEDAARKHVGLVERDIAEGRQPKDYQVDTDYNLEDLATGLNKRSYNIMLNNLQKGITKALEDINSSTARRLAQKGMQGRFFMTPTKKFSPFFEERKDFLQGEENIYDTIFHYFYSVNKKLALDPAIDNIRKAVNKTEVVGTEEYLTKDGTTKTREIKRPYINKEESVYIQKLVEDVKGKYYMMDKVVDDLLQGTGNVRMYSKAVAASRELQANLKLGYKPVGGVINAASGLGYLWTKAGTTNVIKGLEFMKTPEGKTFTASTDKYLGVNVVESATGDLSSKGVWEKLGWLKPPQNAAEKWLHTAIEPTGFFQMGEIPVRRLTMATNYLMAKNSGLGEAAARDVAIKATWFTQFSYDMASLPEIMRGPTGRLLMQFKPYMFKAIEFMSTLRGDEIARYATMQLALAGPRGLVIMLKSLPVLGAIGALDRLEEWMNKEYPRLSRGVGGFFGVDVSAPATFQLPTTERDWLGPTLSNIVSLWKSTVVPMQEGRLPDGSDLNQLAGSTFPIWRYWHNMIDQVITKDGWVKDERGRRLWHIDNDATFVLKNMGGAEPLELNRIRTEERILTTRTQRIAEQKTKTIDDVLDAIGKGKSIDQDLIDSMLKLGIKPGTLRRAAQFRVLDPKQRRLLMTEIIRRPEILENYPDASDLE